MLSLLPSLLLLLPSALASSPPNPTSLPSNSSSNSSSSVPAAVFIYTHINQDYQNASAGASNFTFALSIPSSPNSSASPSSPSSGPEDDSFYFHLSSPPGNSWLGVGFGPSMPGSFMFIAYPSSNGTGVTLSPRVASHGHSEPSYFPSIHCEKLYSPGLADANSVTSVGYNGLEGGMFADGVCRNMSSWAGWKGLNFGGEQDFIFAVGPGEKLNSDAMDAGLKRHEGHGKFSMDLRTAIGGAAGPVPPNGANGTYVAVGSSGAEDVTLDNDLAPAAHAVLMCLAFIVVFPTGSLVARMFKRVVFHAVVQGFGALCVVIGFGVAVHVSGQYNRSRDFRSAHQVLGLLLVCGVVVQFGIGLVQHRIFKRTQVQPKWAKVHLFLGPAIMFLGIVNGGLGIHFADSGFVAKPYIVVVIMVALVYFTCRASMSWCSRRRRKDKADLASSGGVEGYQYPQFHGYAPQYQAPYHAPAYGQSFPMQPYQGQLAVPQTVVYPNKPAGWP